MTRRALLRGAVASCLVAGGAVVGLAATVLHSTWWGLVLGIAATAAALVALPGRWWARLPFAVGWAAVVGWLTASTSEGDYLIAGDRFGYALLVTAFVVVIAGFTGLRPSGPPFGENSSPADPTS